MDGYYIEQGSFGHKKVASRPQCINPDTDFLGVISQGLAINDPSEIIVLHNNQETPTASILNLNDTIKKKDKPKKNRNAPSKDDERKDVTKKNKKISPDAIFSILLGVISLVLLFSFQFTSCLIVAGGGLILSLLALNQINKNPDKYDGRGLAVSGLVLNGVVVSIFIIIIAGAAVFSII